MYSVTKRIDFCYGHRLLDYDGVCRHPHGHNGVAEIEVRTESLDRRNMVVDFSDIRDIVKGWIDRELDHKMILRHDDPLAKVMLDMGEPLYLLDSNPTAERIARLIYDVSREKAFPSTASLSGKLQPRGRRTPPDRLRSRRNADRFAHRPGRRGERAD